MNKIILMICALTSMNIHAVGQPDSLVAEERVERIGGTLVPYIVKTVLYCYRSENHPQNRPCFAKFEDAMRLAQIAGDANGAPKRQCIEYKKNCEQCFDSVKELTDFAKQTPLERRYCYENVWGTPYCYKTIVALREAAQSSWFKQRAGYCKWFKK